MISPSYLSSLINGRGSKRNHFLLKSIFIAFAGHRKCRTSQKNVKSFKCFIPHKQHIKISINSLWNILSFHFMFALLHALPGGSAGVSFFYIILNRELKPQTCKLPPSLGISHHHLRPSKGLNCSLKMSLLHYNTSESVLILLSALGVGENFTASTRNSSFHLKWGW